MTDRRRALLRTGLRGAFILALILLGLFGMNWLFDMLDTMENSGTQTGLLVLVLTAYALVLATPFLPSLQISMTMLALRGPDEAWLIFAVSVLGFLLPYTLGRSLPATTLARFFNDLGLHRIGDVLEKAAPLTPSQRLSLISDILPSRLRFLATRWRYGALMTALNTPGNVIVGGASGLLLMCGLSRVFAPMGTILTVLICLLPMPILVTVFDIDLGAWISRERP